MICTAGMITEFNPFHNGHRALIEQTRASGATHIVAVMSGSFVQRGEPAILSKWQRTAAALQNGVDLVLELPIAYALSSAQRFAAGGVATLAATGVIDLLSFGSESGDILSLEDAADACLTAEKSERIHQLLKEGLSYPAARQQAVADLIDHATAKLLESPNNTLGIEYLKACRQQQLDWKRLTVRRIGAAHDGAPADGYASGSWLRNAVRAGQNVSAYLPQKPETDFSCIADGTVLERAILQCLRGYTVADFSDLPDVTEGLENRLYAAAQQGGDLADLLARVKTKRYPLSRLRRILWSAMIGITKQDVVAPPQYLRVLGISENGKALLRKMKDSSSLPIVSSFVELEQLSPRFAALEKHGTDLQGLAATPILPCNRDYTEKIVAL